MSRPDRDDALMAQFERDFRQLASSTKHLTIQLSPLEIWCLLSNVQLAARHPLNRGPSQQIAERAARRLQALIAVTPALRLAAQRGWDPRYDVPIHEEAEC